MQLTASNQEAVLFSQTGNDGTIVREWSFSAPEVHGNEYSFPFLFWSLTMANSEMEAAVSCFKIGERTFPSTITHRSSESAMRFSTSQNSVKRSYLKETGSLTVNFQDVREPWKSPQLAASFTLRAKRIDLESGTLQALGRMRA